MRLLYDGKLSANILYTIVDFDGRFRQSLFLHIFYNGIYLIEFFAHVKIQIDCI